MLIIVAMPWYPTKLPTAAIPPSSYWWVFPRKKTSKFF